MSGLHTTLKPSSAKSLPVGVWTTVVIATCDYGTEQLAYNYVNINGVLVRGHTVGKVRVRALRNGVLEGQSGFDETANNDHAVVADSSGNFGHCITTFWMGARRQDTLHWQVKPSLYVKSASALSSRHATNAAN